MPPGCPSRSGDDGRVRVEVPSADDLYHVLHYRSDPDDAATEHAVAIHMGADGGVVLTEPLPVGGTGAYRVETFRKDTPGDADGDGTDDLAELADSRKTFRAPLNPGTPNRSRPDLGAVAIPDMETFRALAFLGNQHNPEGGAPGEPEFADVTHLNFIINLQGDAPRIYFANQNLLAAHFRLTHWAGFTSSITSEMAYYPYVRSPGGTVGTFVWGFDASGFFADVSEYQELIARNMPFLRNNLAVLSDAYPDLRRQRGTTTCRRRPNTTPPASRSCTAEDLYAERRLSPPSTPAVGFGLLRVLGPGERPTFRDIVILRAICPTICLRSPAPSAWCRRRRCRTSTCVPSRAACPTPTSPTPWRIETITALIGRYVRFEVKADPELPARRVAADRRR